MRGIFRGGHYSFHRPGPSDFTSVEQFAEYKRYNLKMAEEDFQKESLKCRGYYWYLRIHELELYLKEGVTQCFDTGIGLDYAYDYSLDPTHKSYIKVYGGSMVLLNLGLLDRARKYIDIF